MVRAVAEAEAEARTLELRAVEARLSALREAHREALEGAEAEAVEQRRRLIDEADARAAAAEERVKLEMAIVTEEQVGSHTSSCYKPIGLVKTGTSGWSPLLFLRELILLRPPTRRPSCSDQGCSLKLRQPRRQSSGPDSRSWRPKAGPRQAGTSQLSWHLRSGCRRRQRCVSE